MLHLAVDDTDSRSGMCTTFLANRLLEAFPELDLIGYPRLVRLNPSVPWKTRGNGAIALTLGQGRGEPFPAARLPGADAPRVAYPEGDAADIDAAEALDRAAKVVEAWAELDDERTQPGLAAATGPVDVFFYRRAVQGIVEKADAEAVLERANAEAREWNGGRGLIGAAGALAWAAADHTWELVAYRERDRWGEPREVDAESVAEMARAVPSTFDSYDFRNDAVVMTPRSPCPVLYGVRGDDAADLHRAAEMVEAEPVAEWTLFQTNQGTDDHLQPRAAAEADPLTGAIVEGRVAAHPEMHRGGHAFFPLEDASGRVTCAAFEPTKQFRTAVMHLREGDRIQAYGSVGEGPDGEPTLHLEKLRVLEAPPKRRERNPRCAECRRSMKSKGAGAGYRCPGCGKTAPEAATWVEETPRDIDPGWYEVPSMARRHLAKPLQRLDASGP